MKYIFIFLSLQFLFTENIWAACGPPQCPIESHQIVRKNITREQCMSQGLYVGDRFVPGPIDSNGDQFARIYTSVQNVTIAQSHYTHKTGICEYDYTFLDE